MVANLAMLWAPAVPSSCWPGKSPGPWCFEASGAQLPTPLAPHGARGSAANLGQAVGSRATERNKPCLADFPWDDDFESVCCWRYWCWCVVLDRTDRTRWIVIYCIFWLMISRLVAVLSAHVCTWLNWYFHLKRNQSNAQHYLAGTPPTAQFTVGSKPVQGLSPAHCILTNQNDLRPDISPNV